MFNTLRCEPWNQELSWHFFVEEGPHCTLIEWIEIRIGIEPLLVVERFNDRVFAAARKYIYIDGR